MSEAIMSKLKVTENGPYLLSGADAVKRLPDGRSYPVEGGAALCRCGGSKNKPFCDGTHGRIGFSGEKDAGRVLDEREDYAAAGITIHDNRGLCAHAGRCTDGLPSVFRLRKEPFVDPEAASPEEVAATIRQCPSGALSYSIEGSEQSERGGDPVVAFVPNGPYVIRGGAELEGAELLEGATTDHFALCRCGKSANKPFCSGAHWNVQFDEDAPKQG
jgi:CDGSH-type Zn-finger protein